MLFDYRVTVAERDGRIVVFMAELEGWIEHLYMDVMQLRTGIGSAALLLGESISGREVLGSALVFVGLLLTVLGPRLRKRLPAEVAR